MDLRTAFVAVRSLWWVVALCAVLGGLVAGAVSLATTPRYTTQMQFFVSTADSVSTSDVFTGSQFAQQRVASYSRLLEGEELANGVISRLGLDRSTATVQDAIKAAPVPETVLIDVSVIDTSASRAQEMAEVLADEFVSLVEDLETPASGTESAVRVTLTDPPDVPTEASEPQWTRNLGIGVGAGLVLGVCIAVGRDLLDRTVRDPEEVVELVGVPVIGTVLRDEALVKRHTIDRNSTSRAAEDYRQLRTNLQFLNVDEPPKVIMVTSAIPSEGKTTAVVNLGLALADAGRTVTIVEADLRKPKVTRYLGLVGGVGLTNILAGTADLDEVVQRHGSGELSVIAAGPTPPNPGELLASSQMFSLLDKLRVENDFVLVDAPPLLPVADSTGLAVYMDGVVLSLRYGSTRKEQLVQAATTLERVGAKTLGVILNIVPPKAQLATAYGYGVAYGYDEPAKRDDPTA